MNRNLEKDWLILFAILFLTIVYLSGIPEVPFHPDESTQLFMSADIDLFFTNPTSLFWLPDNDQDLRQHYRELDAPLTRYLAGIGRQITHQLPLPADWDWSASWEKNHFNGAVPEPDLLHNGRLSISVFFPFSLYFLFKIMQKISDSFAAWISVFFFASNALILLHTRRTMAEGILTFTILLTLYMVTHLKKRHWLIAVPIALAFSAKQSAAPLILIGLVVSILPNQVEDKTNHTNIASQISKAAKYLIVCLVILFLLNPFLWRHPLKAGQAALDARKTLTTNQLTTIAEKNPEKILLSIPERILGVLVHLFLTPPAIADVANYQEQILKSAVNYLNNPLNNLYRGPIWGSALLTLSLFGFFVGCRDAIRGNTTAKRALIILLLATTLQFVAIAFLVTLPFQRYVVPLIPYSCIWQAYGLSIFMRTMQSDAARRGTARSQ